MYRCCLRSRRDIELLNLYIYGIFQFVFFLFVLFLIIHLNLSRNIHLRFHVSHSDISFVIYKFFKAILHLFKRLIKKISRRCYDYIKIVSFIWTWRENSANQYTPLMYTLYLKISARPSMKERLITFTASIKSIRFSLLAIKLKSI